MRRAWRLPRALSLRTQLVLLVMAAVLPALIALLASGLQRRASAEVDVLAQTIPVAQLVAATGEAGVESMQQTLLPIARLLTIGGGNPGEAVRGASSEACLAYFTDLLKANPGYTGFGFASADGSVACSAPASGLGSVAGRADFRQAMASGKFSASSLLDREGKRPVLVFTYPILDRAGVPAAAVIAGLDLRQLAERARTVALPEGAAITLLAPDGLALARFRGAEVDVPIGVIEPYFSSLPPDVQRGAAAAFKHQDSLMAAAPVRLPGGEVLALVTVAVPASTAYAGAEAALRRDLSLVATVALLALLAAWWLGERLLARRIGSIGLAARSLTAGDLGARVPASAWEDELGILGTTFNEMAAALEERTHEVARLNAGLEQRVMERTAELETANASLSDSNAKLERAVAAAHRLERSLQQRTVALEATNHELEAFAYAVSHDLRAPLRAIDGFSQTLLRDYEHQLDEQGRDRLRRVRAATQRLGTLIDDLLQLSRTTRSEMQRERLDLTALAKSVAAELRDGQPGREVEVVIQDGLNVEADRGLMRAAMQNLLQNAWKFTGKRERARIEVGAVDLEDSRAFFVRDDGAGFDPQYAAKLFGAFQRLHSPSEFEGNGIGLATVQRIIHRHGGRVWAEGAVEQGATFYFTLPRVDGHAAQAQEAA